MFAASGQRAAPSPPARTPAAAAPPRPGVVCHLISSNFVGGPEKQLLQHCTRLGAHGWSAVVGSFRENRPRVEVLDAARSLGLPVFWIDTRSPFSPLAVRQLRRQLADRSVSVLVTYGYKSNLVGALACRGAPVAHLPFVRGYTAENWRIRRYETVDRWLLRRTPRVLCVSHGTRRMLLQAGVAADHVTVVHNAIDCEQVAAIPPVDLRAAFGLPADSRVLAAAGRLSPEKGHRFLIAAVEKLAAHQPPVHLVLLGAGVEEENLRRQANAAGLSARIVFAGFRPDVLGCLAGADVVVNPSLTEGLPNVLLEAFALRRPVVATNVGGSGELVQPDRTGWLVPAGDPAALATAIGAALDDAPRAARMAAAAWELVSRSFTFAQQAEQLTRVYRAAKP